MLLSLRPSAFTPIGFNMNLSGFREDLEKQLAGAPIYIGDACFFVKRWGTPESNKVRRDIHKALFGPFHKAQDGDDNLVNAEWLCWAVTKWENVFDDAGEVTYTEDRARNVFTNPEYYLSLNLELVMLATRFEYYLHEEMQEDEEEIKKP